MVYELPQMCEKHYDKGKVQKELQKVADFQRVELKFKKTCH